MDAESRLKTLEKLYSSGVQNSDGQAVSTETLLDIFVLLFTECSNSTLRREKSIADFVRWARPIVSKITELRLHRDDFETLKVIGRGAFGEVAVVRQKETQKVYAMKLLNKWEMLKRAETACFIEERDVLVYGDKRWLTNLHYAFQDQDYLYLVMDYYSGGDLLTLLSKHEDRLPESMAQFYIAEMVLAIDSVHKMGYVHRDIKPDNILVDQHGHIRLGDFGSCLKMLEDGAVQSSVAVGTPDYISPEILRAMEDGRGRYGAECDWWSLGVCMYEMLFGETPFYAESLVETYGKIMNHKNQFDFPPEEVDVSEKAQDLIRRLICDAEHRLGRNGLDDFKNHSFFESIDWDNIRNMTPPYIPDVKSPTDTSNFDVDESDLKNSEAMPPNTHAAFSGNHLPFVGFSFTRNSNLSDLGSLATAKGIEIKTDGVVDSLTIEGYERRIKRLEAEKSELNRRLTESSALLQDANISGQGSSSTNTADIQRLKSEIMLLKKQAADTKDESSNMERNLKEALKLRKDLESVEEERLLKIKFIEKSNRALKSEKQELTKDFEDAQERLRIQAKELKDAQSQRKLAMQEFSEINDRLSDLRSQKQKLSRSLRDKEEELDSSSQKNEKLRLDFRKSEKKRRELEIQVEEMQTDLNKEKKLKNQSNIYANQLEDENRQLKSGGIQGVDAVRQQETDNLKAELERCKESHEEALTDERTRHAKEEKNLKDQILDNEQQIQVLEKEVATLKERSERDVVYNTNQQKDIISDLRRTHEREKSILKEENQKLATEVERKSMQLEKLLREHKNLEEEVRDMSDKKDSIAHWEAQIAEIIQWVSDEKDARGYLQSLATKMTDELQGLKDSGPMREKAWQTRRSQKMEKMELLNLQSQLKSEINAKNGAFQELKEVKYAQSFVENKLQKSQQENDDYKREIEELKLKIEDLESKLQQSESSEGAQYFRNFLRENTSIFSDDTTNVTTEIDGDDFKAIPETHEDLENDDSKDHERLPKTSIPPYGKTSSSHHPEPKAHTFKVQSFHTPTKCMHCTSLMLGQDRQGLSCDVCRFVCHSSCAEKTPGVCPMPEFQSKRPLGIDPNRGIGTAYEGFVGIPKPGGVRKGWMRQYAVVCDFKLFLFDMGEGRLAAPTNKIAHVIDMRDEEFSVSSVLAADVIHANRKDVPCIFKVSASQLNPPRLQAQLLLLADTEGDKHKWVQALSELGRILRKNKLPDLSVFEAKEIYDSSLPLVKITQCADIVDGNKFVMGTDDGLYTVEISTGYVVRADSKRVYQVQVLKEDQLVIVISGKGRHLRLFPIAALDQDVSSIKVEEPRGCTMFTTGRIRQGSTTCLCIATRRHVYVYELNRTRVRHRKIKDIALQIPVQCMEVFGGRLCVGYSSGFGLYTIQNEGTHLQSLVNPEDPTLAFITTSPLDSLAVVDLNSKEYLLCFMTVGVYVDYNGKRSRHRELMWPSPPTAVCYAEPYLIVYSETSVDVFDIQEMQWIQTIPIKGTRVLSRDGRLNLSFVTDLHQPRLVYLKNKNSDDKGLELPEKQTSKDRRKISFKSKDEMKRTINKKSMISGPSNFNHLAHMGPGDGLQILKDLPINKPQEDAPPGMERVKSMFQPAGLPPATASKPIVRQRPHTTIQIGGRTDANNVNGSEPSTSPKMDMQHSPEGFLPRSDMSLFGEDFTFTSSHRLSLGSNNSSSSPPTPQRTSFVEPDQGSAGSGWESEDKTSN
ncbi:serine/threonine-protein kinase MRCK alpha-like isoform X2 [Anneissia japonica]|uniref:serine/threonine-protein kinase MRCK alpha-like isoform X2 n=1 Tax=Anneissia japonica TaxID=1529436 RepID=UPI0014256CF6|nr:serine/threonine-protein kinase MRCK alpha-like isoform X2 [Anneissia japonica]